MSDALRRDYQAALQLQQRRCEAYHTWKEHFNRALAGNAAASDLDRVIQKVVLTEFQEVSTGLRTLQAKVKESAAVERDECSGSRAYLIRWINRIQDVEKAHYEASVEMARALASHSSPNVVPLYLRQAAADAAALARAKCKEAQKVAAKYEETQRQLQAQRESSHAHASAGAITGCAAEAHAHTDATGTPGAPETQPVTLIGTAAAAMVAPLKPSLSLHDELWCPLTHALPRHERGGLFFVRSTGAIDPLGDDKEQEEDEREAQAEEDEEVQERVGTTTLADEDEADEAVAITAAAGEVALEDRQGHALAYYTPHRVARRCLRAERLCARLRDRQRELEEAAGELYEELQCEFSDL